MLKVLAPQPNAIKLSFFVGWVELRCTHQIVEIYYKGGFRSRSTHPTISLNLMALLLNLNYIYLGFVLGSFEN